MPLKYQVEIDNFGNLLTCPENVSPPQDNTEVFRFVVSPIEHQLNFVPNVVRDRELGLAYKYRNDLDKCMRCGISLYLTLEGIADRWDQFNDKIRENLGFTHVARGVINSLDGLMRVPDENGHFGFYENEGVDIQPQFNIHVELELL